jgi:hypothetical protein
MRRCMAAVLVFCLGALLPLAATPLHVCLLDAAEQSAGCCDNCTSGAHDCCAEVRLLPDALMPSGSQTDPALVRSVVPHAMVLLPRIPETIAPPPCFAQPRAGIGPPTDRFAVLNVWIL